MTGRLIACVLLAFAGACSNTASPGGAARAYERGVAALAQGRPRTARVEFMNAIQAQPGSREIRLLQAQTYLQLGDGIAAQAEVERARQLGAPAAGTGHLMAHALLLQKQPRRALEEAARAGPAFAGYAARIRGRALTALGDDAAATAAFDQAIAAAPKDPRAWIDLAAFRRANGDIAGAIERTDKALALKPGDVAALTLRGELTRGQYGLAAALPWFDRALERDPDNVGALLERAATLGDLGRTGAMLADTRKVLSLSGSAPVAFHLQAMMAARAGKFELARALHRRSGGALDDQPAGMLLAGAIDYQTGNVEQAVARLDVLVALQPENRKARRLLAAARWKLGDGAGTVATLRPLADRPDADSYALALIGTALARQGDTRRAAHYLVRAAQPQRRAPAAPLYPAPTDKELDMLRSAAQRQPDSAQAQIQLVGALLSRGLGEEALQRARAVQAENPGVPDAHVLVGDTLGMRGDPAGAAQEYRKAANLAFTEPVALRMIEALQRSGQEAATTGVLSLFLQQNPRNVPAQLLAGGAYMRAGQWREAIRTYEALRRRLGNRDAILLGNLAWAYWERGEGARAILLARKAWSLDRDNPATADLLGWLLFKSGRNKMEGLALLQRAARGAPTEARIRNRLDAARRR